jgi:hypothetical protein
LMGFRLRSTHPTFCPRQGPIRVLALISSLFPNPEMNKIMATAHGPGRNQITQPTYC